MTSSKVGPTVVQIASYNCNLQGDNALPQNLVDWLKPTLSQGNVSSAYDTPDIIAVGFQELLPLHLGFTGLSRSVMDNRNHLILQELQKYAGTPYTSVARSVNVGVALLVYAKDAGVARRIDDVQTSWTGCGPAYLGNKGAVGVRFRVKGDDGFNDEVFTFVCVHLIAHAQYHEKRIQNYKQIARTLLFPAPPSAPQSDHTTMYATSHLFFFGDCNFRLRKEDPKNHEEYVRSRLDSPSGLKELAALDELSRERKNGRVCQGLREGDFTSFRPTYKHTIGSAEQYSKKRTPAWTDRIMFTTYTDSADTPTTSSITPILYTSAPSYISSDHKPVTAILRVPPPGPTSTPQSTPLLAPPPKGLEAATFHNVPRIICRLTPTRFMSNLAQPLVCIIGTTGTGKSQLAVDLALALSQETKTAISPWKRGIVINSDAMQIYEGLDIVTNKVTEEEMKGVDHRLLGIRKPGEEYFVSQWVMDAIVEIDQCHQEGTVPIVAGGTAYWVQHLLFPNRLVSLDDSDAPKGADEALRNAGSSQLAASLSQLSPNLLHLYNHLPERGNADSCALELAFDLHSLLSQLDPPTGSRWHWKDTRKVLRSLEIIKESGQRASDLMSQQDEVAGQARYPTLVFWLYASPDRLNPRLDERVDKMVARGMLEEISTTRAKVLAANDANQVGASLPIDYTQGIYQTIGFKEFDEYLSAPDPPEELLEQCVETMKRSTRKYAQRQVKWIQHKLLPAIRSQRAADFETSIFLLDATESWREHVFDEALHILRAFLKQRPLKDPRKLSETAAQMLQGEDIGFGGAASVLASRKRVICAACTNDPLRPVMIEEGREWQAHAKSRAHRHRAGRERRIEQQMEAREEKRGQRAMGRAEYPSAGTQADPTDLMSRLAFTRALAALSRYGEDMDIQATPNFLSLSATNSSKSAYGRFKIAPGFFEKYKVGTDAVRKEFEFGIIPNADEDDIAQAETASGQILVKSVLSILRHRGFEKSVEKCELSIVPGRSSVTQQASGTTTSSDGGYQSVLLFRLHCKHGVTKTHRLSLNAPPAFLAPHIPASPSQSRVVVGPRAIKDLIDHFAKTKGKGARGGDLQLIWAWGATEVKVRTLRGLIQGHTDSQIATSITVEAEEFDEYDISDPPVSLSFHLREFIAATTLAENLSLQLNLSFTEPAAPLCITIESDYHESLFVLATRQVPGTALEEEAVAAVANGKKRGRDADDASNQKKKSMKVVTVEPTLNKSFKKPQPPPPRPKSPTRTVPSASFRESNPPLNMQSQTIGAGPSHSLSYSNSNSNPNPNPNSRPLFLPSSQAGSQQQQRIETFAQLSQAEQEVIRGAGLGLEDMDPDELAAMLEDAGDEDFEMEMEAPMPQPVTNDSADETRESPDWFAPAPGRSQPAMSRAGLRAPDGLGMSEEEINEMEMDPFDNGDGDGDSFLPFTQTSLADRTRNSKHFEALDFGDD
ncbi:hypothetical protein FRB97_007234 [Tulasnella sp. 331]|nr:hypothetical protein FRB97_007234 [Tulasnella sp. 331]